ncbi:hypothetical protein RSAG8_09674, partial [Rhizoctonia solani AG-8 WAC10335]
MASSEPASVPHQLAPPTSPLPSTSANPDSADATPSGLSPPPKKKLKRNRITLSCTECHRRKQQCDRGNPCSRCVKRGMAEQCYMESPPVPSRKASIIDTSESERLTQRIEQLEALVRVSYGHAGDPATMSVADMAALLSNTPQAPVPAQTPATPSNPREQPSPERAVQDAATALGQLSQANGENPLAVLLSQLGSTKPSVDDPNPADPVASFPASPHVTGQLARYFFEASSIHWYCSAIRTAQSMGMHRDGEGKWHMNPVEAEQRRRLWWILYTHDRLQNFVLCRPYVIHDQHCDCRLPLNADQAELIEERELTSHPLNQPTEHTFQLLQISWSQVLGQISDHCFNILTPSYRTVLHMEHQIRLFELGLPTAFQHGATEGNVRPYIMFQSQLLVLQIHHAKVLLLRPFIYKRDVPPYEEEHRTLREAFDQYACDVCIQVCKRLLAFQQIMHSQIPRHQLRWFLCVISVFDAALTLASVLVLQPHHALADDIDYWVRAGQDLLRSMASFHHVASESVKALHTVRNRALSARGLPTVEGDGHNPPTVSVNVPAQHYNHSQAHNLFDPLLSAELDRAHRTLGQSSARLLWPIHLGQQR